MSSTAKDLHAAWDAAYNLNGWGPAITRTAPKGLLGELARRYDQGPCHPRPAQVFRAVAAVGPPAAVRVVILGQDPYHGPGQADGLAFSVQPGQSLPPSLRNIFKEIALSCGGTPPLHGELSHWAKQGVLLLNDVLTVGQGQAHSHADLGWQQVTGGLLSALRQRPAAFLLWGKHARARRAQIMALSPDHLVLEAPHPSPLSAYRGFHGCGHFKAVNVWLEGQGEAPVQWWPDGPD